LKSVEFLIALALLLGTYAWLYRLAASNRDAAKLALAGFNESLQYRRANSIINNMVAYGDPFEYRDFSKLDPSRLERVTYEPGLDRYTYETYPRW
jgi:hypothetical protein